MKKQYVFSFEYSNGIDVDEEGVVSGDVGHGTYFFETKKEMKEKLKSMHEQLDDVKLLFIGKVSTYYKYKPGREGFSSYSYIVKRKNYILTETE